MNTSALSINTRLDHELLACRRVLASNTRCEKYDISSPPLTTASTPETFSSSASRYIT